MSIFTHDDEQKINSISKMYDLVASLYGPIPRTITLKNNAGYISQHVVTSRDLFSAFQPEDDVIRMMFTMFKNPNANIQDGGLFLFLLASKLIIRFKTLKLFVCNNEKVIECITKTLGSIQNKINVGKLNNVKAIARGILQPKLRLTRNEMEHICVLFASAFASSERGIRIITQSNISPLLSLLHDGLLLPLEKYSRCVLSRKTCLRILLVEVSISLDSEDLFDQKKNILVKNQSEAKKSIVNNLLTPFCTRLKNKVDFLVCQKVIHPKIKELLKEINIACVDRVGGESMEFLKQECQTQAVSSLFVETDDYVKSINCFQLFEVGEKPFLKMTSASTTKTLLLGNTSEKEVEVLRQCYEAVMCQLYAVSQHPFVVYGGGCTETAVALNLLRCTQDNITTNVARSFLSIAQLIDNTTEHHVDMTYQHHWIHPNVGSKCFCGTLTFNAQLKYVSFLELLNISQLPQVELKHCELPDELHDVVVHPAATYSTNVRSAFYMAQYVSKISLQIVEK